MAHDTDIQEECHHCGTINTVRQTVRGVYYYHCQCGYQPKYSKKLMERRIEEAQGGRNAVTV
jgi:hypothetical protein